MAAIRFLSIPGFGNEGNEDVEKLLLLHSLLLSFLSSLSLSLAVREGKTGYQEENEQQTSVHDISISIKCLIGVYISSFGPTRSRYRSSARFLVQPRVSSSFHRVPFLSRTTRRMSDVSWRWAASLGSRGEGRDGGKIERKERERVRNNGNKGERKGTRNCFHSERRVYRYCIFKILFHDICT